MVCVAGVGALGAQIRCIDAAREAARLAARGDGADALAVARTLAPSGAELRIHHDGGFVAATVAVRPALVPGIRIGARAVAAEEPPG